MNLGKKLSANDLPPSETEAMSTQCFKTVVHWCPSLR